MTISRRLSPQVIRLPADSQDLLSSSTHSQTCCRNNAKFSTKKSVKFAASDENDSSANTHYALCDDTKKDLWWTQEEIKDITVTRKDLVKKFIADHDDENDSADKKLAALYNSCTSLTVSQVLRSKANKQLLSDMKDVRGLEAKVSRSVCRYRKHHVRTMLSFTEQGDTEEVLAAKSAKLSRTSQILARVLAQVDAHESL